jgi:hypothetical protein
MNSCKSTLTLLLGLAALPLLAPAENWPQWRGPNFSGSSSETGLPVKFSKTENVAWTAPMTGPSAASPVVWEDSVFVSSTDKTSKTILAVCLERKTGNVRWQHKINDGYSRDDRSNYASPSPVTDGKLVVFFYGNGDLVTFDFAGKELWRRNLQKDYGDFAYQWTFSASPTLFQGCLLYTSDAADEQCMV